MWPSARLSTRRDRPPAVPDRGGERWHYCSPGGRRGQGRLPRGLRGGRSTPATVQVSVVGADSPSADSVWVVTWCHRAQPQRIPLSPGDALVASLGGGDAGDRHGDAGDGRGGALDAGSNTTVGQRPGRGSRGGVRRAQPRRNPRRRARRLVQWRKCGERLLDCEGAHGACSTPATSFGDGDAGGGAWRYSIHRLVPSTSSSPGLLLLLLFILLLVPASSSSSFFAGGTPGGGCRGRSPTQTSSSSSSSSSS